MTTFAPKVYQQQVLGSASAYFKACHELAGTADKSGPVLAVEYKGADRWTASEDDRLIGGLWANLSEGRCRFVMVKETRREGIEENF